MTLRVVVFDLDDTLYLERDYVRSGFQAVDAWLVGRAGRSGLFAGAWESFVDGQRVGVLNDALAGLGLDHVVGLADEAVEVYRHHRPTIDLVDGARETLAFFADRGDAVALLTDGRAHSQRRKIDALGIAPLFDMIVVTDELGGRNHWKPSPEGYELIESQFGVSGEQLAYIADNRAKDFVAPRQLGWKTVRVRHPGGLYDCDSTDPTDGAGIDADELVDQLADLAVGPAGRYLLDG